MKLIHLGTYRGFIPRFLLLKHLVSGFRMMFLRYESLEKIRLMSNFELGRATSSTGVLVSEILLRQVTELKAQRSRGAFSESAPLGWKIFAL